MGGKLVGMTGGGIVIFTSGGTPGTAAETHLKIISYIKSQVKWSAGNPTTGRPRLPSGQSARLVYGGLV